MHCLYILGVRKFARSCQKLWSEEGAKPDHIVCTNSGCGQHSLGCAALKQQLVVWNEHIPNPGDQQGINYLYVTG